MTLYINSLALYKNVNYSIGSREIPPVGSSRLPAASRVFTNVRPSRNGLFELDLPMDYLEAISLTYLRAECSTDGQGSTTVLYGWITRIEQIAGTSDVVRIRWEIDSWRTYSASISIRSALVRRQPTPPVMNGRNMIRPVYQTVIDQDDKRNHISGNDLNPLRHNWVLLSIASTENSISSFEWWMFPIDGYVMGPSGEKNDAWELYDIYGGQMDEILGISPNTITGQWVIPFCPMFGHGMLWDYNPTWDAYYYHVTGSGPVIPYEARISPTGAPRNRTWLKINNPENLGFPGNVGYNLGAWRTDDNHTVAVCNQLGQVAWQMPYYPDIGTAAHPIRVAFSVSCSATSCSILVFFTCPSKNILESQCSQLGLTAEIPAVQIPVSSNAWSDYLYSGARQFDIESQKTQNEAAMYKGMLNAGNSAMFGAFAGAAVGNPIAGGIIGGIGQILGSAIGGSVDEGLREKTQELKDAYMSNQSNTVLMPGASSAWIWQSKYEGLRIVKFEQVNPEQAADLAENGYYTDQWVQGLHPTAGPWTVTDMTVTGDVPTEQVTAIKKMFAAGVKIIERNRGR